MSCKLVFSSILIILSLFVKSQDFTLKIWPNQIPGSLNNPTYQEKRDTTDIIRITQVSDPTISIFLPSPTKACGTAVIICPGGGYSCLAFDYEGTNVAIWLAKQGIIGIVLKYRLPNSLIMKDKSSGPLQDAQEAIRIVRRHAKEWKVDSQKIGIMGFSAGGHLAATLSTHYDANIYKPIDSISARPDFSLLIYPVISMQDGITHTGSKENLLGKNSDKALTDYYSNELQVTSDTPPAFLIHTSDDNVVSVENSIKYLLELRRHNIPAELHIYEKGGHGYSLKPHNGTTKNWPTTCLEWLRTHHYL